MESSGLHTQWQTDPVPLAEHPRPQEYRDGWLVLNGWWNYAITDSDSLPVAFDGRILVPYSPECLLSGVQRVLKPNHYLHYLRTFSVPDSFTRPKVLLHFGAVDRDCTVYVNGTKAGAHQGGYNSFSFDITALLAAGENTLHVAVTDDTDASDHTRSKQRFERGGIWYTPSSGIWQTVWLENVAERYLSSIKIIPDYDSSSVTVFLEGSACGPYSAAVRYGDSVLAEVTTENLPPCRSLTLILPSFTAWSPENPQLYELEVRSGLDFVRSYFGMRKFEIRTDSFGNKRFYLNNAPYFMHGLLDQGYFSDGMYTAPCDEALENDVQQAKRLGYNTLRKHIKVESMRWYYHCDRLGMLVWQDMPSGGAAYKNRIIMYYPFIGVRVKDSKYRLFGRANKESREAFYREYEQMITQLVNVPSVVMWVPFNEGWGQFDARQAEALTRRLDPTRLVDHASGWHDQGGGDFTSLHVYYRKVPHLCAKKRAVILSEFGGYSQAIDGHCFTPGRVFGYKIYTERRELNRAFAALYETQVIPRIAEGLCADIYTQLSDVEDEVNGLLTYDRAVTKIDTETALRVRDGIDAEMKRLFAASLAGTSNSTECFK